MSTISSVRPSPIAGSWYTSDPVKLDQEIRAYIDQATVPTLPGEVLGLVAPHAGYVYSGSTAGYAYRCVRGCSYDICAVFSPMHDYLPYEFLTSAHQAYSTPLGEVPVDQVLLEQCARQIKMATGKDLQRLTTDQEHSLEIQLPFLQVALATPFSLLPFMVRSHEPTLLRDTALVFAEMLKDKKVLLVASTDLSHYNTEKEAITLDSEMLRRIINFSPEEILEAERNGKAFACGVGAVALVLWIAGDMGATKVTLLHQTTSAKASGDTRRVVGYGAAAITR